jgi:SAM domain (Sterile alpha motif)
MDIVVWLRSLGLGEYEPAFRENAIDLSILRDLTDQDLEKIGVLLGHRRKLLRAIANLEIQKASASLASPATTNVSPRDAAERRQVTVMLNEAQALVRRRYTLELFKLAMACSRNNPVACSTSLLGVEPTDSSHSETISRIGILRSVGNQNTVRRFFAGL